MPAVFVLLFTPVLAGAEDSSQRITFVDDAQQSRTVDGKILTHAQDGGFLLIGQDGKLWTVGPDQFSARTALKSEFRPLDPQALARQLQTELGPGFEVIASPHYLVCANTSKLYAQWCSTLFERLYTAFHNYWKQRGVKLQTPEFPLVAIIFANEQGFAKFATKDAGAAAASAKGYYSVPTNRMVLYDLTTTAAGAADSPAEMERRLDAVAFNVATVVHEATHQIAFNSGLHTRLADNPLWLTEGMAMYFETPDLKNKTGWRTGGAVNRMRLKQFQEYAKERRPRDSLRTLIGTDGRFSKEETAGDAYAEAWALSYFLINKKGPAYASYLNRISAKPCLIWDSADERLSDFLAEFGPDFEKLDDEFLRYIRYRR